LIILIGFFWIWWRLPLQLIPPHFEKQQLDRLALQDALRRTNLQIWLAIAGTTIVVLLIIQLLFSARQWSSDFEMRTAQLRITQFVDAMKLLETDNPPSIAGMATLRALATEEPARYLRPTIEVLDAWSRQRASNKTISSSDECS